MEEQGRKRSENILSKLWNSSVQEVRDLKVGVCQVCSKKRWRSSKFHRLPAIKVVSPGRVPATPSTAKTCPPRPGEWFPVVSLWGASQLRETYVHQMRHSGVWYLFSVGKVGHTPTPTTGSLPAHQPILWDPSQFVCRGLSASHSAGLDASAEFGSWRLPLRPREAAE